MTNFTLTELVNIAKQKRGFVAEDILETKINAINTFFANQRLNAAVVGVSGGIDSALVYKLLVAAAKVPDSPLKHVRALLMPINCTGTTNQDIATERGLKVAENTEFSDYRICELGNICESYIAKATHEGVTDWAIGQLASILRTPNMYFHAALLQQSGLKSITVGTINRDEGAYLGFFGKASDAMVDLQPIADLHKSEVYALAKLLNVHEDILNATPAGDVWDNRSDEEMIGAPYWFIELYQLIRDYGLHDMVDRLILTVEERIMYLKYQQSIEMQHAINAHKYQVQYPSHYIDILPREYSWGFKRWWNGANR